jgi:coiled-coil and C2 domain-containing protein 2A
MAHRLLRYVSLIPYEADSVNFSGSYDLWGTNSDFLTCLIGDDEEHAVLLISYFLRIEMTCPKLLFGYSIDNGNLCWVTTLDEVGQVQLWDPLNGTSYRPNDPRCPLTAVYCAADQANVYYNVQSKFRIPV